MAVRGYLRALLIAMAVPLLNHAFMGVAGFLQLRSLSVGWGEAIRAATEAPLNYALVQAASVGVIFIIAFPHRSRGEGLLESVHVRPLIGGIVGLCFASGAFLQLPFAELGNLVQEAWPISFEELARRYRLVNPTTWSGGVSALIALVLVAPVTEELLFRGWILKDLEAEYGRTPALLWSSLLFGLVHIEASAVIYATLAGLVLGAVALRAKSTLASIALHAGVNAVPLLVPANVVRIEGFNTLDEQVVHISAWLLITSLLCAAATLRLFWRATEPRVGDE
jgi:membrane protease YdiL (CAAX protease family)